MKKITILSRLAMGSSMLLFVCSLASAQQIVQPVPDGTSVPETALTVNTASPSETAGSAIDMAEAAQRERETQIADLKGRINDLETQAQSDDDSATEVELAANSGGGFAFLNALGLEAAQSSRNDAANERAQAEVLREQLVALQGNSDGADPQGQSFLGAVGTALETVEQEYVNKK